jgi:hypothetical protein
MLQTRLSRDLPNHQPHRTTRQRLAPLTDKKRIASGWRTRLRAFDQPGFNGRRLTVVEFVRTAVATNLNASIRCFSNVFSSVNPGNPMAELEIYQFNPLLVP